ncbi:hypothetical protein SLS60_002929 [Paraconiothyrium brasiliense]|uniref:Acyltransferase 3 domain-containing protein n=1 Tax=Paraconiothyrium brasiliense TaxID=300254 RepID=A0ABR3RU85_9PLEO
MARTHSLDNLRTFLTVLVIFHHASIPYGGLGSWPYKPYSWSPSAPSGLSSFFLAVFNVTNQTFFMALFFLISGYFSAISASKRPRGIFLKEKAKRLGVPCMMYSILGPGVVEAIIACVRDGGPINTVERVVKRVGRVRGARGPVWYCGVLFVFDAVFALTFYPTAAQKDSEEKERDRQVKEGRPQKSHLSDRVIFAGLAFSVLASFLLRLRWPIGTTFTPLGVEMGFLPQYVVYYATGIYAQRTLKTELQRLVPRKSIRIPRTLIALEIMRAVLYITLNAGFYFAILKPWTHETLDRARGGWNPIALWYGIFNEALGFVLCVPLLRLFSEKEWAKRKWAVGRVDLARWNYAAFLVHAPVVVGLQCMMDRWAIPGMTKSAIVGSLGCVGSWAVGFGLGRGLERMGVRGYI